MTSPQPSSPGATNSSLPSKALRAIFWLLREPAAVLFWGLGFLLLLGSGILVALFLR